MKTTALIKKTFNLSLASLVGVQTTLLAAPANYFDDILDNSLMNVTPGGLIYEKDSSGRVMQSTFHTGSFSFRFGGAFNYPQPIITLSPPKMSAGCGGLSVKGMFASVIGLDRFEEMLKNAGASLAWGIAVGLIYSLPGIGAAFRMIESWASKIQQLLANACQSGMAIGSMIAKNTGFQDNALSNKLAETDKAVASLDGMVKDKLGEYGISKYFDDNMVFSGSSASSSTAPTADKISENWRKFLTSGLVYYSVSTNALMSYLKTLTHDQFILFIKTLTGVTDVYGTDLDFTNKVFFITFDNKSVAVGGEYVFDIAELLTISNATGTGAGGTVTPSTSSLNQAEAIARTFTTAATIRSAGTDLITINNEALKHILSNVRKVSVPTTTPTAAETAIAEKTLSGVVQGTDSPIAKAVEDTKGENTKKLAKDWVNYLFHGNTEGKGETSSTTPGTTTAGTGTTPPTITPPTVTVTAGSGARDLDILGLGFNLITIPGKEESNKSKLFAFYPTAKKNNNKTIKYFGIKTNEEGARPKSLRIMKKIIQAGDFSSINTEIPFLVPGIIDKMKIIQQSLPYEQADLISLLADYNSYMIVKTAIINLTDNNVSRETLLPIVMTKQGDSNIQSLIKDLSIDSQIKEAWSKLNNTNAPVLNELSEAAMIALKESVSIGLMSPEALESLFRQKDLDNRKRQIKITPNSPGGY